MKRSAMIRLIDRVLRDVRMESGESRAERVLKAVESAGMLPPGYLKPIPFESDGKQYPLIPGDFKNENGVWCTPNQNEWEPRMINPDNDGIDHINVYSKGKTELGRFLSNFARAPIDTEDGPFASIEGYWYWLSCKHEQLRSLYGYDAKAAGRHFGGKDWMSNAEFKRKILTAIDIKLQTYPDFLDDLVDCKLPLKHYYVYGGKVVEPKEGKWIIDYLESKKRE